MTEVDEVLYVVVRTSAAAVIMALCFIRANLADERCRRWGKAIILSTAFASGGLLLSFLMLPWLRHLFVGWFLASATALLLDAQEDWRDGPPHYLIRPELRPDRRDANRPYGRRSTDGPPPGAPGT